MLGSGAMYMRGWCIVFFCQAEDGIRDKLVTGVQTCALPISPFFTSWISPRVTPHLGEIQEVQNGGPGPNQSDGGARLEEGRVGEECRSRWSPDHLKKKKEKRRRASDAGVLSLSASPMCTLEA